MFLTLSFSLHSPSPKINKILKTKAPAPRGGRQPVGDTPGCVVALACSAHSARRPPACPRSTWSWSLPLSRQPEPPLSHGPVTLTPHTPARRVLLARGGVGSPQPCSVPLHPRLAHRPPRKYLLGAKECTGSAPRAGGDHQCLVLGARGTLEFLGDSGPFSVVPQLCVFGEAPGYSGSPVLSVSSVSSEAGLTRPVLLSCALSGLRRGQSWKGVSAFEAEPGRDTGVAS